MKKVLKPQLISNSVTASFHEYEVATPSMVQIFFGELGLLGSVIYFLCGAEVSMNADTSVG